MMTLRVQVADEAAQQVQQTGLHADIEATGRLVHEHQPRRGHQVPRDLQALLHAARKGRGAVVDRGRRRSRPGPASRAALPRISSVVPRADGHQTLADVAARADRPSAARRAGSGGHRPSRCATGAAVRSRTSPARRARHRRCGPGRRAGGPRDRTEAWTCPSRFRRRCPAPRRGKGRRTHPRSRCGCRSVWSGRRPSEAAGRWQAFITVMAQPLSGQIPSKELPKFWRILVHAQPPLHALRPSPGAEIGVRTDEHPPARVIGDHLVEIAVLGAAEVAVMRGLGGV